MNQSARSMFFKVLLCAVVACSLHAAGPKPIVLDPSYDHDKFGTLPVDIERKFQAFTVSFDSADDDDGDEIADVWAIPQWVAYQIKRFPGTLPAAPARPEWFTDDTLHELGIAPSDASYHFSMEWRTSNPNSRFLGYDRGHMCMKQHAWRMGADADWNTHTLLNACPQRADLNQGIWQDLENKTARWADRYGSVWVITGPVIYGLKPQNWLGQRELGEVMVAIPDAFFKILVREVPGQEEPLVLAFIYPQRGIGYRNPPYNHIPFLTNVDAIEAFTGLNFFTKLPPEVQQKIEKVTATELWD